MNHHQQVETHDDAPATPDVPWTEIEARFRVWSFHVYYDKLYANELDCTLRFCKALIASSQPIRDHQKVIDWYVARRRQKRGADVDAASVST